MSYLINSEKIPFEEFGKMLADTISNVDEYQVPDESFDFEEVKVKPLTKNPISDWTLSFKDWTLDDSIIEINKDILYHSPIGEVEISANQKFFIIYDENDSESWQKEAFVESISEKIGDNIVMHNLDNIGLSGYGKNGERLQECWKEYEYESVKEMIQELNSEHKNTQLNKNIQENFSVKENYVADRDSNFARSSVKEKLANNKAAIEARESSEPKPVKEKQQPEFAL